MTECDKGHRHISSKLLMLSNARHSVPTTFTPLHYTSPKYTSLHFCPFKLHPTTLHYTSLSSHFTYRQFSFLPLHFTSHHYASPHRTSLHFQTNFATFLLLSPHLVYNCFPKSFSKGKVPNSVRFCALIKCIKYTEGPTHAF